MLVKTTLAIITIELIANRVYFDAIFIIEKCQMCSNYFVEYSHSEIQSITKIGCHLKIHRSIKIFACSAGT